MRRTTTLTTAVLTAALAGSALAGCSSTDKGSDAKATTPPASSSAAPTTPATPTATAAKHVDGHLDYTGSVTGGADFTGGVKCEVVAGKFIGVTSPDLSDPKAMTKAAPSFIAGLAPHPLAMLVTPDRQAFSEDGSSTGVKAQQSGGTWKVTVDNLKITKVDGQPGVTVNGSLTCTSVGT